MDQKIVKMSLACAGSHKNVRKTCKYSTIELFTEKLKNKNIQRVPIRYSNASTRSTHVLQYFPLVLFIQNFE
jgi:hypothetical protein